MMKMLCSTLASVVQLVGAWSHKLKGCRLDSQPGHMPRLWVQSVVGACVGGNQSMLLSKSKKKKKKKKESKKRKAMLKELSELKFGW